MQKKMYCASMREHKADSSTYSAIFATLLILLIIGAIAYNASRSVYKDYQDRRDGYAKKDIIIKGLPDTDQSGILTDDVVLHDNLTDEEADRIIGDLLRSGETNLGELKKLETKF